MTDQAVPMLSVAFITYNHEALVGQALESALSQETDFPYEIVVGEDRSTDDTAEIVAAYAEAHPERVRLLTSEKNLGMIGNYVRTITACRGRYVALLEGDDYWTDPRKLQKQVDLLESHPDWAICFHNVSEVCADGSREPWNAVEPGQPETAALVDAVKGVFMPTCSVVFRNGLIEEFPDWFFDLPMADWALHIFNARHGAIGYIDEVMGVHRRHVGGVWSRMDEAQQMVHHNRGRRIINRGLAYEFDRVMRPLLVMEDRLLTKAYAYAGDFLNSWRWAVTFLVDNRLGRWEPAAPIFRMLLHMHRVWAHRLLSQHWPALHRLYTRLKGEAPPPHRAAEESAGDAPGP